MITLDLSIYSLEILCSPPKCCIPFIDMPLFRVERALLAEAFVELREGNAAIDP